VVAKWVNELDMDVLHVQLNNETSEAAGEPEKILDLTNSKLDI
jgi:aerobic C4-dicarboxylate transport protein